MELDNRAVDFIQRAKAQGFSKDEVAKFLQDKGYDIGETPKYSALDKAKYMGRAGAEGLTLGAGDVVGGYTNILANNLADVTHGKDLKTRLKGAGNLALNLVNPGLAINRDKETFNQGRKDFVEEQEQFAQAHPGLNFAGELGGGLILGGAGAGKNAVKSLAKPTLWNMVKSGARTGLKEGAKWGAGYGFGSGLTEDANELNVYNALKGMGVGAVTGAGLGAGLGGALPVGIAGLIGAGRGVGKGVGKVTNFFKNKNINAVKKVAGEDVTKSIQTGRPLIDFANEGTLDLALGTKQADPKAGQIYRSYSRDRLAGQRPIINEMLEKSFGKKGSSQLLDELQTELNQGAKVLYDKAVYQTDKAGNILLDNAGKPVAKVLPELERLSKPEIDYISKVYNTKGLEYEIQGLPQNDMRILNYAKQLMDDDIQRLTNQGHNNQARILSELRAKFIEKIDKANPEYKQARAFFERGKKAEDALQMGRNFDKGRRENKAFEFNKLTDEQKKFYRLGVGDRIAEHTNTKTDGGNISQRVFDAETGRRLKLFGVKNADELLNKAKQESITASNLSRLLQGSQTAEKEASKGRWATNPNRQVKGVIASAIDNAYAKVFKPNAQEVARLLTDPKYLAEVYGRANRGEINPSIMQTLNQIGTRAGGVASEEPTLKVSEVLNSAKNTINNKGGYIGEQPKVSQVLNSLEDGQIAYHGTPIRDITQLDTAFMGKGEGMQAHGWGTYLAKDKVTGEGYRERLSRKNYNPDNDFDVAQFYFARNKFNRKKALNQLAEDIKADGDVPSKNGVYKILQTATDHELANTGGQLYEVKIPKNDLLLDEQKTFLEQPKKVQEALKNHSILRGAVVNFEKDVPLELRRQIAETGEFSLEHAKELFQKASLGSNEKKQVLKQIKHILELAEKYASVKPEKRDIYSDLIKEHKLLLKMIEQTDFSKFAKRDFLKVNENATGKEIYNYISDKLGGDKEASLFLNSQGIKGITYDGRRDGRSFVIFDPKKNTKINRTFYSVLMALASAGLLNNKEAK